MIFDPAGIHRVGAHRCTARVSTGIRVDIIIILYGRQLSEIRSFFFSTSAGVASSQKLGWKLYKIIRGLINIEEDANHRRIRARARTLPLLFFFFFLQPLTAMIYDR